MSISYRQRGKKKTWDYRVFNTNGKVVASNSGFRTKREATLEAQEIENKVAGGLIRTDATLYELWQVWFDLMILPDKDLAKSTKNKYQTRGNYIKKYFSGQKLSDIRFSTYQAFIKECSKSMIRSQVGRMNGDIKRVLQMAKKDGLIFSDFTEGVQIYGEKYRKRQEEKYLHSIQDYKVVLIYLKSKFNYMKSVSPFLLYFLFKTGLRVGEGMATSWDDLDFEKKLGYTYRRFAGDKQEFCSPKTPTSVRYYPLSDDLIIVLQALRKIQDRVLSERGIKNPDNLVFFDYRYGVPTNTAFNKYIKKCLIALEIDCQMTATGTRHTFASYLLSQGVDVWAVAKILGHKNIKQILDTYGHILKEKLEYEFEATRKLVDK